MTLSVLILGGGGHTKVLLDCLFKDKSIKVIGILDQKSDLFGKTILDIPVLGCEDDILSQYQPSQIKLVNGIGSIGNTEKRQAIFDKWQHVGFSFLTITHFTAYLAQDVRLSEGAQVMAGSIIQPSSFIGKNTIINTKATVDHDCVIEDHVHLAPGVVCSGNVVIGAGSHIGVGAVIRQGVKIAKNCLIAAGAVVVNDVAEGAKVAGIPAMLMT